MTKADVLLRGPKKIDSYNNITISILYVLLVSYYKLINLTVHMNEDKSQSYDQFK